MANPFRIFNSMSEEMKESYVQQGLASKREEHYKYYGYPCTEEYAEEQICAEPDPYISMWLHCLLSPSQHNATTASVFADRFFDDINDTNDTDEHDYTKVIDAFVLRFHATPYEIRDAVANGTWEEHIYKEETYIVYTPSFDLIEQLENQQ